VTNWLPAASWKKGGIMGHKKALVPTEVIVTRILFLRGEKVLLDRDLAELYGVETKQLKRAVRRNIKRFPEDFMFELNKEEWENLKCHFDTSSWGGTRYAPMAFTYGLHRTRSGYVVVGIE
jgi:superfamily I DNA and RNA helicase